MKSFALVSLAGLLSLAACGGRTPEQASVANNAQAMERSLQNRADELDALAASAADQNATEALQDAADNLEDTKDNVADAAHDQIRNLR